MHAASLPLPAERRDALMAAIEPVLRAHGVTAVEITFQRERPGWVLRVTIEDPTKSEPGEGITLDRCADVSRDLSHALDVADAISQAYHLEVASPGVERPLRTAEEFHRFRGKRAKVLLTKATDDGQMALRGDIEGADGDTIAMIVDGKRRTFFASDVKSAHLVFEMKHGQKKSFQKSSQKHGKSAHARQR